MNRLLALAIGFGAGGLAVFFLFQPDETRRSMEMNVPPVSLLRDQGGKFRCTVQQVFDGDSFQCRERMQQVRLLLIDSPEKDQGEPHLAAQQFARQLLPTGAEVVLETDVELRDSYKRVLAYAWLPDGRMVNEEMVRAGHALLFPFRMKNVRHLDRLAAAEDQARREPAGFWATGPVLCTPENFRRQECTGFQ